jgi:hypothetical protein
VGEVFIAQMDGAEGANQMNVSECHASQTTTLRRHRQSIASYKRTPMKKNMQRERRLVGGKEEDTRKSLFLTYVTNRAVFCPCNDKMPRTISAVAALLCHEGRDGSKTR